MPTAPYQRIDLTDFSGGILEAISPGDFTERQNAIIKGFILEDEVRLRTQGAMQRISARTDVAAVHTFRGDSQSYLVIIKTDGSLAWCVAPSRTATNATTAALSFTAFGGVTANTAFRFTCELRWKVSNEYVPALLVHSRTGTAPAVIIYESGSSLTYTTISNFYPQLTNKVDSVMVVNGGTKYTSAPTVTFSAPPSGTTATGRAVVAQGVVIAVEVTNAGTGYASAPTVSFSGGGGSGATATAIIVQTGVTGAMPRHNVGSLWRGTLILADIMWSAANSSALAAGNVTRYPHYAWQGTDGTDPTMFDPRYPSRIAEEGAVVVGLQEVAEGMLVMTTTTSGTAGLTLLRGSPTNYTVETLRPGMGLPPGIDGTMKSQVHCWWNEIASTVFVDSLGKLYQVRGVQTDRLDRYGPTPPEAGSTSDSVACIGPWLFMVRDGRLLVMRSFGSDGAWTELVAPTGTPTSLSPLQDTLYFVASNKLYRYCVEGPVAERGKVEGSFVDLTFGTRTLGNPQETYDKWWAGLTLRAQGVTTGATVKSITLIAGAALESPTPATAAFTLNHTLAARDEVSVNGLGPSVECAASIVFQGDVRIENVSFLVAMSSEQL